MRRSASFVLVISLLLMAGSGALAQDDCDTNQDCNDNDIDDACETGAEVFEELGTDGDFFGRDLVRVGDRLYVGSPGDDEVELAAGAVHVYELTVDGLDLIQSIRHLDLTEDAAFGHSIFVDGDILAVGAPGHDDDSEGCAYVYRYDEDLSEWAEAQTLTPDDVEEGDQFGNAVAVSGDWLFVGSPGFDYDDVERFNEGQVYIYLWNPEEDEWQEDQVFSPEDIPWSSRLGWNIDVEGDVAAFSAPYSSCGRVFVVANNDGVWEQVQEITPNDGVGGDRFSEALDLSGRGLIIGAKRHAVNNAFRGAVYYFRMDQPGTWTQQQKLVASDGRLWDDFGASLSLDQHVIRIGAPRHEGDGAVYTFTLDDEGTWIEVGQVTAEDEGWGPDFGASLVADQWLTIAAAPEDTDDAGAVCASWPMDCNGNGIPDSCDIDDGTSDDANEDSVPDECQVTLARFLRGDVNGDGDVAALTDALALLLYQFADHEEPPCMDAADVNGDNQVSALGDALVLLQWGFAEGDEPAYPGPTLCGFDPDQDDGVSCDQPAACD